MKDIEIGEKTEEKILTGQIIIFEINGDMTIQIMSPYMVINGEWFQCGQKNCESISEYVDNYILSGTDS